MGSKSFLKGAAILGIAGVIVKIMGAFFRIPLGNIIADEGMGYYQASYPIYVLLLTVSTAGIPTAISKLVSEKSAMGDYYGAHRVFKISFKLLLVTGVITSSIMFFGAGRIVSIVKSPPEAYYSMLSIAPALLFVPIMASFRGYFQGMQDMVPTAISQIIEQFGRTVIGLLLAFYLLGRGVHLAAAGASFGAAAGGITGTIIIIMIYYGRRQGILHEIQRRPIQKQESSSRILYRILAIAIPITMGAAIIPVMNMIDLGIVMRRLQNIGYTPEVSNELYGQLTGMAAPLINLPQIITVGLAMSLVPAISDAMQRRNIGAVRSTIQAGTRVALLLGLPAALGLVTLARPIMLLLYPLQKASAINAADILSILGFGVIFLTLLQTFTGILQGLGRPTIPVANLLIGALIKVLLTYVLTGIPAINIRGAAVGTVSAYGTAALLNYFAIKRLTRTKFNKSNLVVKPIISVIAMSISVLFIYGKFESVLGNRLTTLLAVGIGAFIYGMMLLATGGITKADLLMMPGGRRVSGILSRLGLLRK
jgi:stage V sporulation protein B